MRAIPIIIILGCIVYANSLSGGFVYDDELLVTNNLYITSWSNTAKIFTEDMAGGTPQKSAFYRPFQIFTYLIDHTVWRLNPAGYHLTNILLHILAALSFFWLLNVLCNNKALSLLAALLFLTHPVCTSAVAYISGRADILAALFMILSLIFYVKGLGSKIIPWPALAMLAYMPALLSKEVSLIFPAVILLYHFSFHKKMIVRDFLLLFIPVSIFLALRAVALNSGMPYLPHPTTLFQRLPGFFAA